MCNYQSKVGVMTQISRLLHHLNLFKKITTFNLPVKYKNYETHPAGFIS